MYLVKWFDKEEMEEKSVVCEGYIERLAWEDLLEQRGITDYTVEVL
ncbi:hypothetical protein [Metabacillus sp. Hm71]